jgi:hypothetical protein
MNELKTVKIIAITLTVIMGIFLIGLFVVAHLKLTGRL